MRRRKMRLEGVDAPAAFARVALGGLFLFPSAAISDGANGETMDMATRELFAHSLGVLCLPLEALLWQVRTATSLSMALAVISFATAPSCPAPLRAIAICIESSICIETRHVGVSSSSSPPPRLP
jgi:hypothetical protein